VPAGERRALLAEMTAYDRLGRSCWAEFLARWADDLEAGKYVYYEREGVVALPGEYDE